MSTVYTDPPRSRNEAIIKSTIDKTVYTNPPQSRMEDLLLDLKETIEQGGGGTTDYDALTNKPKINSVELTGNKSLSDLGIASESDMEDVQAELSTELLTVSGSPIEFTTMAGQYASSLQSDITPTQDLHGYDKPWAGGAGKNLLPMTVDGIKSANTSGTWSGDAYTLNDVVFNILTDSDMNVTGIEVNGTSSSEIMFIVGNLSAAPVGVCYLSGCPATGSNNTYRLTANGAGNDYGSGYEIQTESGWNKYVSIYIYSGYTANNLAFAPMIRTAGDATFAPYSNICPISGKSSAEVGVHGKNFVKQIVRGYLSSQNTLIIDNDSETCIFNAVEGTTYIISASTILNRSVIAKSEDDILFNGKTVTNRINLEVTSQTPHIWEATWTGWTLWYVNSNASTTIENSLQVEVGNSSTAYEPYTSSVATIQFGEEVYGGTVDFVNGTATVIYKCVDMGDLEWNVVHTDDRYSASLSDDYKRNSDIYTISSKYNFAGFSEAGLPDLADKPDGSYMLMDNTAFPNSKEVEVKDSGVTGDVATYMSGTQLLYELATPTTLTLTPAQLELLKGYNYVEGDVGTIRLSYRKGKVATLDDLLKIQNGGGGSMVNNYVSFGASNLEILGGDL